MLHIGLTGGIGSGKSTIATMFAELGAHLIDADAIARAVVEPGTPGLAQLREEFGADILTSAGELDRSRLGEIAFADPAARDRLNAVVHPLVRNETYRQVNQAPPSAIVVHDVPLIVENQMAAQYHLVLVAGANRENRIARLHSSRGMTPAQAQARMAAQADDRGRRRTADVWIDNDQDLAQVRHQVEQFWHERAVPYAANIAAGRAAARPGRPGLVPPPEEPRSWPVQAEAILAKLRRAGGELVRSADHIGSTSVPGLAAKDVLDLQIGVRDGAAADQLAGRLTEAGFPRLEGRWYDAPKPGLEADGATWDKHLHANADPARAVNLHVRIAGGPGWRYALLFRDWLRDDAQARLEYERFKRDCAAASSDTVQYAAAKEPWFDRAWPRMRRWAQRAGWVPPPA
ncbi:MAG TPA: dephospho-CoA kinase [Ruania sp.]|nr:dephospho-CoA kinase [Ruania sp.]